MNPDEIAPPADFFIIYTDADKGWAEWIAWCLEDAGYSVILQAWDFRPGNNFVLMMNMAVRAHRTVAVLRVQPTVRRDQRCRPPGGWRSGSSVLLMTTAAPNWS